MDIQLLSQDGTLSLSLPITAPVNQGISGQATRPRTLHFQETPHLQNSHHPDAQNIVTLLKTIRNVDTNGLNIETEFQGELAKFVQALYRELSNDFPEKIIQKGNKFEKALTKFIQKINYAVKVINEEFSNEPEKQFACFRALEYAFSKVTTFPEITPKKSSTSPVKNFSKKSGFTLNSAIHRYLRAEGPIPQSMLIPCDVCPIDYGRTDLEPLAKLFPSVNLQELVPEVILVDEGNSGLAGWNTSQTNDVFLNLNPQIQASQLNLSRLPPDQASQLASSCLAHEVTHAVINKLFPLTRNNPNIKFNINIAGQTRQVDIRNISEIITFCIEGMIAPQSVLMSFLGSQELTARADEYSGFNIVIQGIAEQIAAKKGVKKFELSDSTLYPIFQNHFFTHAKTLLSLLAQAEAKLQIL